MDIIVLCVDQFKKVDKLNNDFYVKKISKRFSKKSFCCDAFKILNSIKWVLYEIYSYDSYIKKNIDVGVFDIFEATSQKEPEYIIKDEFDELFEQDNGIDNYWSVRFKYNMKIKFKNLIDNIIECSKIKTCIILIRESLETPEKVVGVISLNKFCDLVDNSDIYGNILYIVSKKEKEDNYWEINL